VYEEIGRPIPGGMRAAPIAGLNAVVIGMKVGGDAAVMDWIDPEDENRL
jgi:hypothetical protein